MGRRGSPYAIGHSGRSVEDTAAAVTATFRGQEDDTVYVWMRRFDSEEERVRVDEAVYQSDYMKNDIGPRVNDVLAKDGHIIQRIVPTPSSKTT